MFRPNTGTALATLKAPGSNLNPKPAYPYGAHVKPFAPQSPQISPQSPQISPQSPQNLAMLSFEEGGEVPETETPETSPMATSPMAHGNMLNWWMAMRNHGNPGAGTSGGLLTRPIVPAAGGAISFIPHFIDGGLVLSAQPQGSARGMGPNSIGFFQPGRLYDPMTGPFFTNGQGNLMVASSGYTDANSAQGSSAPSASDASYWPGTPDYGNNSGYVTSDPSGAGLVSPTLFGPDPFAGATAGGSSGTVIDPFAGATAGGSPGTVAQAAPPPADNSGGSALGGSNSGGASSGAPPGAMILPSSGQVSLTPNAPFSGGGTGSGFGGVGPQFSGGGGGFFTLGDAVGSSIGSQTGGYMSLGGGGAGNDPMKLAFRSGGGLVDQAGDEMDSASFLKLLQQNPQLLSYIAKQIQTPQPSIEPPKFIQQNPNVMSYLDGQMQKPQLSMGGPMFRGGKVPGIDKGRDSVVSAIEPGELIFNKKQQAGIKISKPELLRADQIKAIREANAHYARA